MSSSSRVDPARIPAEVRSVLETLERDGHETVLVGGCVRGLQAGRPVRDFDVATAAPAARVLALFPRAVPIGLRHGTVMLPTRAGPVDVTGFRAPDLRGDLARRDFTVNAVALRRDGALVDPFGGLDDLAAGRLRAVGSAPARFAEDPLRALRAGRFVATLGLAPDPRLEPAAREVAARLSGVAAERIRHELVTLLLGAHAGAGLEFLARAGLVEALVGAAREDAPAVVARLPARLELRLAGWLRGLDPHAVLARLRFGRRRREAVARLLRHHPVEREADPSSLASVRRLLAALGSEGLRDAVALRRAELAVGRSGPSGGDASAARLEGIERAAARLEAAGSLALERGDLALDGRAAMKILGREPGPWLGRALEQLTECVLEDPGRNTAEALREELLRWAQRDYEQAVLGIVAERDFVTFAALHRELVGDAREPTEILLPGNRVIWAGMPRCLFDAILALLERGALQAVPGTRAAYVRDGRVLDLPVEKGPPPHRERRWFPVLLRPGGATPP